MWNRWIPVSVAAACFITLTAPVAVGQNNNCVAFKAINQGAVFPDSSKFPVTLQDCPLCVWGGTSFAVLGEIGTHAANENMLGYFYGKDAPNPFTDEIWRRAVGIGRNGTYKFTFGQWENNDWIERGGFTLQLDQAVWTFGPGSMGLGYYQATGRIASGTGVFLDATGGFTLQGDFLGGVAGSAFESIAFWNPELAGKICLPQ